VTDVRSPRQSFCAALFTALLFFPLIAKADGKRLQRDDFRATTIDGVGIFVREIALPESKGAEPLIHDSWRTGRHVAAVRRHEPIPEGSLWVADIKDRINHSTNREG
jgi:hypothetical protein